MGEQRNGSVERGDCWAFEAAVADMNRGEEGEAVDCADFGLRTSTLSQGLLWGSLVTMASTEVHKAWASHAETLDEVKRTSGTLKEENSWAGHIA